MRYLYSKDGMVYAECEVCKKIIPSLPAQDAPPVVLPTSRRSPWHPRRLADICSESSAPTYVTRSNAILADINGEGRLWHDYIF